MFPRPSIFFLAAVVQRVMGVVRVYSCVHGLEYSVILPSGRLLHSAFPT